MGFQFLVYAFCSTVLTQTILNQLTHLPTSKTQHLSRTREMYDLEQHRSKHFIYSLIQLFLYSLFLKSSSCVYSCSVGIAVSCLGLINRHREFLFPDPRLVLYSGGRLPAWAPAPGSSGACPPRPRSHQAAGCSSCSLVPPLGS